MSNKTWKERLGGDALQALHTIRAATRDVGDGTCKFVFGCTEDILPVLEHLTGLAEVLEECEAAANALVKRFEIGETVDVYWPVSQLGGEHTGESSGRAKIIEYKSGSLLVEYSGGGTNWVASSQCRRPGSVHELRKALARLREWKEGREG